MLRATRYTFQQDLLLLIIFMIVSVCLYYMTVKLGRTYAVFTRDTFT